MSEKKEVPVLGAKPTVDTDQTSNTQPLIDTTAANMEGGMAKDNADDKQYNDFDCEVVNKEDNYLDVKYSRNDANGEFDESKFAVSRFNANDIYEFDKVKKGKGTVKIAHGPLTDELIRYDQNAVTSE